MIRRAHRLGIAIDREHFHALTSKFEAEMVTLEKDIANYIPSGRLHEFCSTADEEEEPSKPWRANLDAETIDWRAVCGRTEDREDAETRPNRHGIR